jgi:hypothetical protein
LKVKATRARPKVEVTADGKGIVSRAGLRLPAEAADDLGLTEALSDAMAPTISDVVLAAELASDLQAHFSLYLGGMPGRGDPARRVLRDCEAGGLR